MKVELSQQEQKQLERAVQNNPVHKFLRNREQVNFEIGDILVKRITRWDSNSPNNVKWVTEAISHDNPMPQRYVFVHKDEFGIGYMKQLKVSTGKLGKELYCLTDYDMETTRFEVDPEYAERIFLDAEFDIKDLHKKSLEARKIISKMNRKIGVKPKTLQEFNDFFKDLKPGDKFWMSSDYTGKWIQEYDLVGLTQITMQQLEASHDWSWRNFKEKWKNSPSVGINAPHSYKVNVKEGGSVRSRDIYIFEMGRDMVFYKQQPAREEKKK